MAPNQRKKGRYPQKLLRMGREAAETEMEKLSAQHCAITESSLFQTPALSKQKRLKITIWRGLPSVLVELRRRIDEQRLEPLPDITGFAASRAQRHQVSEVHAFVCVHLEASTVQGLSQEDLAGIFCKCVTGQSAAHLLLDIGLRRVVECGRFAKFSVAVREPTPTTLRNTIAL
eukprot:CAMPEP_0194482322 /NCGR_PEP_ID=MMETSP0253-20130528/4333_1 /TAXON_ID=2966 /ORGANISM="Noctiluca scintillans" /LENGTH=173 /DNA_ID=CAMNT_0039321859 /DNA_START=202 /DNA_END=723 /DNA_ORIENTATION=-